MRILFILGHNRLTGVNLWANDLAGQLIKKGYEIEFMVSPLGAEEKIGYIPGYTAFYEKVKNAVTPSKPIIAASDFRPMRVSERVSLPPFLLVAQNF